MTRTIVTVALATALFASTLVSAQAYAFSQSTAFAQNKDVVVIPPSVKQSEWVYPPKSTHQNVKPVPAEWVYPPKSTHQNAKPVPAEWVYPPKSTHQN